ncbi:hypothetical protein HZA97_06505 [Candidatus Woesearchaeota archaeon]|nr:hypothetical protein [Candidatus Woesearchaeota archaeon]
MIRIILDTNFLVYCAENKVDFISELKRICDFQYELFVVDKTIQELDKLRGKVKDHGRLAKAMIKQFGIKEIKSDKHVDETIVDLCDANTIVATHDRELIKKLNCRIIAVRQRKYLVFSH